MGNSLWTLKLNHIKRLVYFKRNLNIHKIFYINWH